MNRDAQRMHGLVAATFTPLEPDGAVALERIEPLVDHLQAQRIAALYVLGSTGEGVLLSEAERRQVAEQFVRTAAERLPVIVQVGCESPVAARGLAQHAQSIGATAISAVCPLYFRPPSLEALVQTMAQIAAGAPELPFYYYHIPALTGARFDMREFLRRGGDAIPSLRGIKFTAPEIDQFQACVELDGGRFEMLWGRDEMLLAGCLAGARAAVGSTYNFAAPIYHQLLKAVEEQDLNAANQWQSQAQAMIRTFARFNPRAAQKAIMAMVGCDCGPVRLPVIDLDPSHRKQLHKELEALGFFRWLDEASRVAR